MNLRKLFWFIRTKVLWFRFGYLGKRSYLGRPLYISSTKRLFIGDSVRIYPGMRAELVGESARISFDGDISIGQNLHIVSYNDNLKVGRGVTISGNVFISNVDHEYSEIGVPVLKQSLISRETIIGDNCFIGYGAMILPGTKLGRQCVVGANAVVKGEFEDYSVIVGVPGKVIKKIN
ncbi:acyltransferase [Leuconostoc falkenbergense]|uniref:acyltransferase n=1 Tax=Leuconostoc falkenbergense TaxID=2766470 RepID=UPI0021A99A03|nr:acyltransferase [Leuconostoc falkenbergense]MCT4420657.1 acyltransferase [Leuconostoc falkenbergense]